GGRDRDLVRGVARVEAVAARLGDGAVRRVEAGRVGLRRRELAGHADDAGQRGRRGGPLRGDAVVVVEPGVEREADPGQQREQADREQDDRLPALRPRTAAAHDSTGAVFMTQYSVSVREAAWYPVGVVYCHLTHTPTETSPGGVCARAEAGKPWDTWLQEP